MGKGMLQLDFEWFHVEHNFILESRWVMRSIYSLCAKEAFSL